MSDYILHIFITCSLTLFFLRIFDTHVFTHVICSIDLFSVQGATLSQKKVQIETDFINCKRLEIHNVQP